MPGTTLRGLVITDSLCPTRPPPGPVRRSRPPDRQRLLPPCRRPTLRVRRSCRVGGAPRLMSEGVREEGRHGHACKAGPGARSCAWAGETCRSRPESKSGSRRAFLRQVGYIYLGQGKASPSALPPSPSLPLFGPERDTRLPRHLASLLPSLLCSADIPRRHENHHKPSTARLKWRLLPRRPWGLRAIGRNLCRVHLHRLA